MSTIHQHLHPCAIKPRVPFHPFSANELQHKDKPEEVGPSVPDGDNEQHTHAIREERTHPTHQSTTKTRPGTSTKPISFLSQPNTLSRLIRLPFRLRHQRVQFIQTLFDIQCIQHAAALRSFRLQLLVDLVGCLAIGEWSAFEEPAQL